jgi:glycosyltransferase involved in cell wall biosynthesis
MRCLVVNHSLPSVSSNGGPMTVWAIINRLIESGWEVQCCVLKSAHDPFYTEERLGALVKLGVRVETIDIKTAIEGSDETKYKRWWGRFAPRLVDVFPTRRLEFRVQEIYQRVQPDVVFAYHWDCLAACSLIPKSRLIAGVGDPWAIPLQRQWAIESRKNKAGIRKRLNRKRYLRVCEHYQKALLNDCAVAGSFQADEALKMEAAYRIGTIHYFRTPLVDPENQSREPDPQKAVYLLGPSNLNASSTSAGLEYFIDEIYPAFLDKNPDFDFVVRIVGEGTLPKGFERYSGDPRLEICGRIDPPDVEFEKATAQLVPTPMVFGIRVRIIAGMSYGQCIITTPHEKANIPELVSGKNCLIAETGESFADQMIAAHKDRDLRKHLSQGARQTFDASFSLDAAARPIVEHMERMVVSNAG